MNTIVWPEFEQRLRVFVRRRVNAGAVDDVVSEIFLHLVQSQDKLAETNNPISWVYRVASNVITDYYRKSASNKRLMDTIFQDTADTATAEGLGNDFISLANCMTPIIKNLPAPYDQALMCVDIEGISQIDAAKRFGLSASGMKSRVQRGRKKLKMALLRCCDVEINRRGDVVSFTPHEATNACGGSC